MYKELLKYPMPNKIESTMSSIWSKITRHAQKQEYISHDNEEKKKPIETNTEMTQMIKLVDKDI